MPACGVFLRSASLSASVTMSMEAAEKKADLQLTYRLQSTNRAVAGL